MKTKRDEKTPRRTEKWVVCGVCGAESGTKRKVTYFRSDSQADETVYLPVTLRKVGKEYICLDCLQAEQVGMTS